jgi:hypothetical protein
MKRLGSLGAVLPFLALGAAACGANTDTGANPNYKLTMLADFEKSTAMNQYVTPSLWNGGFSQDFDKSPVPVGYKMKFELSPLSPARQNPDGTESQSALHIADIGVYTLWGTVVYGDLQSAKKPVDLSAFRGISLWARSAGAPGFTVKIGIADWGSFDFGQVGTTIPDGQLCDALDTTVGGRGCYDDYAAKIYPDGEWRRYDIPFASLTTGGWGLPHQFDVTRVYRIKISMLPTTVYDLYFDDIAFYAD